MLVSSDEADVTRGRGGLLDPLYEYEMNDLEW